MAADLHESRAPALWPLAAAALRPFVVVAVRDQNGLSRLLPAPPPGARHTRIAGVFVRGFDRDYVAVGLRGDPQQATHALAHEFAHVLVDRHLGRLPVWMDEGLAELLARGGPEPEAAGARTSRARTLAEAALPLEAVLDVTRTSPHYTDPVLAARFYAHAWALVHYFVVADGGARADRLSAFAGLVRRGMPDLEAARTAFGDLQALERRFNQYARSREVIGPLSGSLPTAPRFRMRASSLDPDAARILLGDLIEQGGDHARAQSLLMAAAYGPHRSRALERLSVLQFRTQQFVSAERTADAALRLDGRLALARVIRASAVMAQSASMPPERADAAEADLRLAILESPGLARAHAVLGGLLATARKQPADGLVFARRAVELDPADVANQVALAQVLLLDGQATEAHWLAAGIVRHAATPSEQEIGQRLQRLASDALRAASENAAKVTPP